MIRKTIVRPLAPWPILIFLSAQAVAQSYTFDWLTSGGGTRYDNVQGLDVAPDGTIVITGTVEGPTEFGSITLPGDPLSADGLVAKLDSRGNILWARDIIDGGYDEGRDVVVDRSGNIWVTGNFDRSATFDPATTLTSSGPADAFIAKYAADGSLLFAQRYGNEAIHTERGESIGIDAAGNAYVALAFKGTLTIGGTTFSAPDVFENSAIIKLAPDGMPVWVVHASSESSLIRSIDVDDSGNVALAGRYKGTLTLGSSSMPNAGREDAFAARLNPDGSVAWAVGTGSSWYERVSAVTMAGGGDTIVGGIADRDATVFGVPVRNSLGRSLFVARLDPAGATRWLISAESSNPLWISDVTVESDGEIVLVGLFTGEFRAGMDTVTAPLRRNSSFLLRLDGLGEVRGVDRVGSGMDNTRINTVLSPSADRILLAGAHAGTLTLDGNRVTSRGFNDAWIAGGFPRIVPPEDDPFGDEVFDLGTLDAHIHWRCTALVRRVLGDPDLRCPGVFKHGAAPNGAEDIFTATAANATLASDTEVDQFRFELPDITVSGYGDDHADIRPDTAPFRSTEPEPLEECHAVQRLAPGPLGAPSRNEIWVTTTGQLTVNILPTANDFAEQPVNLTNERVRLYSGSRLLDDITVSSRGQAVITCPVDVHSLSDLRVTFGEREPGDRPRADADLGGYTMEIEYRVDARRGIPEWARDQFDIGNLGAFAPAGCAPGRFNGFPFCVPGFVPRFETPHPRLPRPDCLADGPGCWELTWFEWAEELERFELTLDMPQGMEIRVLNDQGQAMASASSGSFPNEPARRELVELAADLGPGLYFLAVNGPPATIGVSVGIAVAGQGVAPAPRLGGLSVLQLGVLALLMFVLVLVILRIMRRR